jgi:hypothetical protein
MPTVTVVLFLQACCIRPCHRGSHCNQFFLSVGSLYFFAYSYLKRFYFKPYTKL